MRSLFIVLLSFIIVPEAQAAKFKLLDVGKAFVVVIEGQIVTGDASSFEQAIKQYESSSAKEHKPIVVGVDSGGGVIAEAALMADLIRNHHLSISVLSSSTCASACFILFLASPTKYVMHGARIGVHSASDEQGSESDTTKATTVDFARLAKEAGAPDSVVGKLVSTRPDEVKYLSDHELKLMGSIFTDDDDQPQQYAAPASASRKIEGSVILHEGNNIPSNPMGPTVGISNIGDVNSPEMRAQKDAEFDKFWKQEIQISKNQHSGKAAAEKRCSGSNCVIVLAYYDSSGNYVEAWKYDEPPKGNGKKLVCRQDRIKGQLTCIDWYDNHSFNIQLDHYIGSNLSDPIDDFLKIFD